MPDLRHLNVLDYAVVAVYLGMVVVVGLYVARFNRKTSDYFKGGGHIPWRLSAISLFVSGFSAYMFVSAAGLTYRNGLAALILSSLPGPAYLLGYFVYGRLWRRSRLDSPMQFLTRRYSPGTTYFYTLLSVVPNVLILGVLIYTMCIFVTATLGLRQATFDLGLMRLNGFQLTLLATGLVMVFYTLLGGLWAVMVTDALQFVVLFLVTLLVLPAAYVFLGEGNVAAGVARLAREAPEGFFSLTFTDRPPLFWLAFLINIVLGYNVNWHVAQRYYSVPDERDTKKMALWGAGLSLVLPLMWLAPVLAARVLFPDLAATWPEAGLAEPTETAFVSLAMAVLPHGLLGMMVAAIFAATMSSVDTTFNWLAAVLTKDAFVPLGRRLRGRVPSDRAQLAVGKGSVAVLGGLAIGVAFVMERNVGAFDAYLSVNSLYNAPMFIPVMLGLVYRRTPWWSAMAAFAVGVAAVVVGSLAANLWQGLPVDSFDAFFVPITLEVLGVDLTRYELNTLVGVVASTGVFFASTLAHRRRGAFAQRIESLERDLRTPAIAAGEKLDLRGLYAYRLAGWLSVGLGGLLLTLALPGFESGGPALNVAAGLLALALGLGVVGWTRRFRRRMDALEEAA